MEHHAGIRVSLEMGGARAVDATGRIVREAKVGYGVERRSERTISDLARDAIAPRFGTA